MKKILNPVLLLLVLFLVVCNENSKTIKEKEVTTTKKVVVLSEVPDGMVWVPEKTFLQGAKDTDKYAMPREKPAHKVTVDGFFIDITEVTNAQFKAFVNATNYLTIAERAID